MYPEGIRRLADGWSKNLAAGAGSIPPLRLLAVVVWVAAALQAPLLLLSAPVFPALVWYGGFGLQIGVLLRRIGRFGGAWASAYPVLLVVFVAVFARSLALTIGRRSVPWRGRRVAVRA
jgi:4,4'-diaponeurosporenoate glycosyltransferase